jgi:hypothetical protein
MFIMKKGGIVFFLTFVLLFQAEMTHSDGNEPIHNPVKAIEDNIIEDITIKILNNIRESGANINADVLKLAVTGYLSLVEEGNLILGKPLTVIDFNLPSNKKRFWSIDMEKFSLRHHSLVAHGRNSGMLRAQVFSNQPESFMSSLGFYLTGETYMGKHGNSLRLDGLEKGFNDLARPRAIVVHAADYAEKEFIDMHGRLGRSLGCPALPSEAYDEIIDWIKEGTCMFIYADQDDYNLNSKLLNRLS